MVSHSDDIYSPLSGGEYSKYEERVLMAKFRANFEAKVREMNDLCWNMCVDRTKEKLDEKTATCLNNCVERFIDASTFITQRFALSLQNNVKQM